MTSDTDRDVRIELAVRTLAPDGRQAQQAAVFERLQDLERRGVVDDVSVSVWGRRVGLSTADRETDAGREIVEAVERFRSWADRHGVSVDRFFETREVDSAFTGESYRALELPTMVMAEYHGDELYWVTPCADDDGIYTVRERVETLTERDPVSAATGIATPAVQPVAEE